MNNQNEIALSVVIVNYNVAYFLEQCLNSVEKASKNLNVDVWMVDNNSVDNSVAMVHEKFPSVKVIANKDNRGFSKANNQALEQAKGKYHLLLNPDTVVEEDTFDKIVAFMDSNPNAGGLGVRMIDGKGNFLPESKRGLPTPAVAFYKIFGISRIFPKSKIFGRYHLGYLSEFETNKVAILSGAFMLMRKETLNNVGLLDETFFMYGEDIDLSYRIIKGGFDNYYFPETQIIHYKGESTKKSSVNYVFVFYRAMVIFAEKHFSQKNAKLFSFLINLAIYLRAGMALFTRFLSKIFIYIVDFSIILFVLSQSTNLWEKLKEIKFDNNALYFMLPIYTGIWMLGNIYSGTYDKPSKLSPIFKGILLGTAIILGLYALLPAFLHFSRLFILTGTGIVGIYYLISRILLHFTFNKAFTLSGIKNKRFGIIANMEEFSRIAEILKLTNLEIDFIGRISTENIGLEKETIGNIEQLDEIKLVHKLDELIFSAKDNSAASIIACMTKVNSSNIDFKIAQPDSTVLIGSNSIETAGDLYVTDLNTISKPFAKRYKRTFDIGCSLFLLTIFIFIFWKIQNSKNFIKNLLLVLIGKWSIVGYSSSVKTLPKLKKGLFSPKYLVSQTTEIDDVTLQKLNLLYARDYSMSKDFKIVQNWLSSLN